MLSTNKKSLFSVFFFFNENTKSKQINTFYLFIHRLLIRLV